MYQRPWDDPFINRTPMPHQMNATSQVSPGQTYITENVNLFTPKVNICCLEQDQYTTQNQYGTANCSPFSKMQCQTCVPKNQLNLNVSPYPKVHYQQFQNCTPNLNNYIASNWQQESNPVMNFYQQQPQPGIIFDVQNQQFGPSNAANLQYEIAVKQLEQKALEDMLLQEQHKHRSYRLQFHRDAKTSTHDLLPKDSQIVGSNAATDFSNICGVDFEYQMNLQSCDKSAKIHRKKVTLSDKDTFLEKILMENHLLTNNNSKYCDQSSSIEDLVCSNDRSTETHTNSDAETEVKKMLDNIIENVALPTCIQKEHFTKIMIIVVDHILSQSDNGEFLERIKNDSDEMAKLIDVIIEQLTTEKMSDNE